MYDLTRFTLGDMAECGATLRKLGANAQSMEEVANRIVRYLYDHLCERSTGDRACALVRFFRTQPYATLDPELRAYVCRLLGDQPVAPDLKCLTLLATAGIRPPWNSRHASVGHRALPLSSAAIVARTPMLGQLMHQCGLEVHTLLQPDPKLIVDLEQKTYNVFHIAEAVGSPYIPAQRDFVLPLGIRSVLGFGGLLPSGDLFAVVLFARVSIPRDTADLFKTLALSTKLAVLPFASSAIFAGSE